MAKGCDYSWARPSLSGLKAAGINFVIRYHSHDTTGKNLTTSEANAILANGMDVVSNWEYDPRAALNGRAQGVADAANGINQLVACGGPSTAAIYFSVDFDAQDSDMHAVAAYVDGAVDTIGWDRVGVYGGYRVIANMAATARCKYFWQTYAWSGGQWHSAVHIRQTQNDVTLAGGQVDMDTSTVPDYGGWNRALTAEPPAVQQPSSPDPVPFINQAATYLYVFGNDLRSLAAALDQQR
jgi:hypothetical protein